MYNQSLTQQQSTFSSLLFSTLSKLISLTNHPNHQPTISHTNNQPTITIQNNQPIITQHTISYIKSLQQQFTITSYSKYETLLFNFIKNYALLHSNHNQSQTQSIINSFNQSFKSFLNIYSQTKTKINNIDYIVSNNSRQIKLIVCDQKRLYNLKQLINKRNQKKYKSINNNNNHNHNHNINHNNYNNNHNNHSTISTITKTPHKPKPTQQQQSYKAYIIYGKAINVQRQKKPTSNTQQQQQLSQNQTTITKNITNQDISSKQQTIHQLQYCISLMYQQQKLLYSKCQPNQLQDLLMTHYLQDSSLLPVLVTNQVYKYFIPLDKAILLILTDDSNYHQTPKQQIPFIFKDTLLHVYLQNMKLLNKTISKQSFFKNSTFRGIYFIEQGQVQTKSGRIVARGWVINGKCKSTTHTWKFHKVMTFFKFILHNQNIWKQFVNDLKLNDQWPIKVSDVLNLDDKLYQQIMGQQSINFKLSNSNQRNKRLKFPPISGRLNRSFDITKLNEIQKMKHFDQKIHHLHQLKQQVLKKKIQHGAKKFSMHRQNHSLTDTQSKQMNKRIHILSQKMNLPQKTLKTDISRSLFLPPGQSPANILITGIVQKLKSIHQNSPAVRNSLQQSPRQQSKKKILQINKSRTKILGLKRYQQTMRYEKNHLYKGKNLYN